LVKADETKGFSEVFQCVGSGFVVIGRLAFGFAGPPSASTSMPTNLASVGEESALLKCDCDLLGIVVVLVPAQFQSISAGTARLWSVT
jgi:hypothetical protein